MVLIERQTIALEKISKRLNDVVEKLDDISLNMD